MGKPAEFELHVSVTSLLNSNLLLEAGLTAGAGARTTKLRKHEANDGKCRGLRWYDACGAEAMELLPLRLYNTWFPHFVPL